MTRQGGLFTELKAKIAARFGCDPASIVSLSFEGTEVAIEDDADVLQLEEGETVEVSTKDEANTVQKENDEELPELE